MLRGLIRKPKKIHLFLDFPVSFFGSLPFLSADIRFSVSLPLPASLKLDSVFFLFLLLSGCYSISNSKSGQLLVEKRGKDSDSFKKGGFRYIMSV